MAIARAGQALPTHTITDHALLSPTNLPSLPHTCWRFCPWLKLSGAALVTKSLLLCVLFSGTCHVFTYSVFCTSILLSLLLPVGLPFYGLGAFGEQWPGHRRKKVHHYVVVIVVRVDGSG